MSLFNLYVGGAETVLDSFLSDSIDLTVTSPPYNDLRAYNGYSFPFEAIATQLVRVTKPGGVIVWNVTDATKNHSESGTSFRQALHFMDLGMNLFDTMIYARDGVGAKGSRIAYWQAFEYMFVFSNGRPKSINLIRDKVNKYAGDTSASSRRRANGRTVQEEYVTPKRSKRTNVWTLNAAQNADPFGNAYDYHPAIMPYQLAHDHVHSWSSPNDVILDPFCGSGTTGVAAIMLSRSFIGIDTSEEYIRYAEKRLTEIQGGIEDGRYNKKNGDGEPTEDRCPSLSGRGQPVGNREGSRSRSIYNQPRLEGIV